MRVHRVHREKVLKIDRPFRAGGFLSLTAFQAEGCGIAFSGDEYKVNVTDSPFSVISHDNHSADWLTALAPLSGFAADLKKYFQNPLQF